MKKTSINLSNLAKLSQSSDKLAKDILKAHGPKTGQELMFLRQYYKVRQADVANWIGFTQAAISQMEKSLSPMTHSTPIWYALYAFFSKEAKKEAITYEKYLKQTQTNT